MREPEVKAADVKANSIDPGKGVLFPGNGGLLPDVPQYEVVPVDIRCAVAASDKNRAGFIDRLLQ